ncbi:MAG: multicopper oxidase family protein [Thermoactinomyces sp.]
MKHRHLWNIVGLLVIMALVATACSLPAADRQKEEDPEAIGQNLSQPKVSTDSQGRTVKDFTVVAKEANWQIAPDFNVDALTYDGTVPGKTIQVTEGDRVRIKLLNQMKEPVSIHWHGYPVPHSMDGVPGVTQDAVAPGKSFTYDFIATVPGTYFYHSHHDSARQVDRGLYGAFVVLPKQDGNQYDRDSVLMLDESMNHNNMDHENHHANMPMDHDTMMKDMYNVYTINGKSGSLIKPLKVKKGERVRLRFINAGYLPHQIHLQNQEIQVIASDGNEIKNTPAVKDQLNAIGPGERYDIQFVAEKSFAIDLHDGTPAAENILIPVEVEGSKKTALKPDQAQLPVLDLTKYSKDAGEKMDQFQSTFTLKLNSEMVNGSQVYTINGKTWPDTDPLPVKKGERVKVKLVNEGKSDHPMHLHGHTFELLTKNGEPVSGIIKKDTLAVKPGETYEIGFVANNPGIWMYHCHELHHATAGMMTTVNYENFKSTYQPDPEQVHE